MPTFHDPTADSREAYEAIRGLAHATIFIEQPHEAYGVILELLGGVRSLQQVFDQLAAMHERHQDRAFNDAGDQHAGMVDAFAAADRLLETAAIIRRAESLLDAAAQAAGRIAWHPAEPAAPEAVDRPAWVNIVFLDGEEADRVLDLIDREGSTAGVLYLSQWDMGADTVDDAIAIGHTYDELPSSASDKTATVDAYTMIYNPSLGHVALYRNPDELPSLTLLEAHQHVEIGPPRRAQSDKPPAEQPAGRHTAPPARSWFTPEPITEVAEQRGLSR